MAQTGSDSPGGFFPRFLTAPTFADPERTERARMFHRVALLTAAVVTGLLFAVGLVMLAGLLLGARAGLSLAGVCALIGLGLVLAESAELRVAGRRMLDRRAAGDRPPWSRA